LIKRRSRIFLFVLGMLEKTPQTPTADSNVRSGGVPFQVTPTPDQNNEKKSGTCC